jgi:hypothetical protein
MKERWKRFFAVAKPDHKDTLFFLGLGITAAGVWQIYAPAAFILVGVVLMGLMLLSAARKVGRG